MSFQSILSKTLGTAEYQNILETMTFTLCQRKQWFSSFVINVQSKTLCYRNNLVWLGKGGEVSILKKSKRKNLLSTINRQMFFSSMSQHLESFNNSSIGMTLNHMSCNNLLSCLLSFFTFLYHFQQRTSYCLLEKQNKCTYLRTLITLGTLYPLNKFFQIIKAVKA